MDYESLTKDEQIQIIKNRLRQYEGEYFNHQLNAETLKVAKIDPKERAESEKKTKEDMQTLETAIIFHRNKLSVLEGGEPVEQKTTRKSSGRKT